jgi:pimeloyl-ACP methyl ester carboxylesterase
MGHWWIALVATASAGCSSSFPDELPDGPRCTADRDRITCAYVTARLWTGVGGASPRDVHFMLPEGESPAGGWPVAMLFQGSFFSAERAWEAQRDDSFGAYHQTALVRDLLGAGFAVLAPETRLDGATFWDTNTLAWAYTWQYSEDHALMTDMFAAIDAGSFGPLATTGMLATGISSGGYMSSRVGIEFSDRFAALAIHSASYMTCSGLLCSVPDPLPAKHPPTLFLHGEADDIVPAETARDYHDRLRAQGIESSWIGDREAGHAWLAAAPIEIVAWALAH